jgi:hypothetical protein
VSAPRFTSAERDALVQAIADECYQIDRNDEAVEDQVAATLLLCAAKRKVEALTDEGDAPAVAHLLTAGQWTDLVAATRMGAQGLPELEDPYRIGALGAVIARLASMATYGWRPEHARHLDAIATEAAQRAEDADDREGSRVAHCDTEPAGILAEDVPNF